MNVGCRSFLGFFALISTLLVLSGCQSSLMIAPDATSLPQVKSDKALVVFMRPSTFGGGVQSSVYDTRDEGQDIFAGIVSAKSKVAYYAEPGEHLFMVVGENADFMSAQLDAGKKYYVLVTPRIGLWKARFSLLPIRNDAKAEHNLHSDEFRSWDAATQWMSISPKAQTWFQRNAESIQSRKLDYLPKWNDKAPVDVAVRTLNSNDGI
jgi:hypothetical protein